MKPAALMFIALLLFSFPYNIALNQREILAQLSTGVFLAPSNYIFPNSTIGSHFNVTVCVANVVDLSAFQVKVFFDDSIINVTRWFEPTSDLEYVFRGKGTLVLPQPPGVSYTHHGPRNGSAMIGVSLLPPPPSQDSFNGSGILCIIEFSVSAVPIVGETSWCTLNINNPDTYLLDSDLTDIPATKENGYYESGYKHGPRTDNLNIKYYNSSGALYGALKSGEVDLTNSVLNQTQMDDAFGDPNMHTAVSPKFDIRQFFLNNNATMLAYPNVTSPTAFKGFRQAIACLVNKTHIVNDICNYSYRIDTPIPRPQEDWCVDWSVSQYDSYGNLLGNYPYEYNTTLADSYLNSSGFVQGTTTNPYYDPTFPSSARYLRLYPATNATVEPLVFYIRNDTSQFLESGRCLRDVLRKMGLPVNAAEVSNAVMLSKMSSGNYHISIGGWTMQQSIPRGPDFLSVYISNLTANYLRFRNSTYDEKATIALSPSNLTSAKEAALECQKILIEEAASVWLWTDSQVVGYGNICGVANSRLGETIDNRWTFLTVRKPNSNLTELRYGLAIPPESLNVVTGYSEALNCLDRVYDTMLSYNPYDRLPGVGSTVQPWMAENWDVGEWVSPYEPGKSLTKMVFFLRDGLRWHDGVELNSTDIKFTIDYLKNLGPSVARDLFYLVSDVHHVTTPDARTVEVYENVTNFWALNDIGSLPILPKHVYQNITDVTGYTPGANEGHPANETLIGSGPWKYVNHSSSGLYLEANRDYFMETPPIGEVDFRYDWEMGCYVVDNMDETMAGEANGTSGIGVPSAKWEPECDVNGDGIVNLTDLSTIAYGHGSGNIWGQSAKRGIPPPPPECAVYVEPLENQVLLGENFTVRIKLMNADRLSGAQFSLSYDPLKLADCGATMDSSLGYDTVRHLEGLVQGLTVLISPGPPVSGNMTLATIVFNATSAGSSTLTLCNTKLAMCGAPGSTCQFMSHKNINGGVIIGVPTSSGTNVTVAPSNNVNVTFSEVVNPGVTTVNVTQLQQTPFVSFHGLDIKTTASYSGNITIQFAYNPTGLSLEDEKAMRIWLWNETAANWANITTFVNTTSNIVYGVTPHLSIFSVTSDLRIIGDESIFSVTTVRIPENPPSPPAGQVALNYYQINATKSPPGPIEIHLAYNSGKVRPDIESFVRMWLWDEPSGAWVDLTSFVNTSGKFVCGFTPHMSIFSVTSLEPLPSGYAIVDTACSKRVVGQGYNITTNITIENRGGSSDFDLFVYRNSTVLTTLHVSGLYAGTPRTISFTWNTSDWARAKHGISVYDRLTNWIVVSIPGDVDGNLIVNMIDLYSIALHYGAIKGQSGYVPEYDVDNTGIINMLDLYIAAIHFGQS